MGPSSTSAFYRQLATLLRAGFSIAQALTHTAGALSGPFAHHAHTWSAGCSNGQSLHEQMASAKMPAMEVALIQAGERSGRLPELCDRLAGIAEHKKKIRSLLISRLIYPTILIHMALVVPAIPKAFLEGEVAPIFYGPGTLWVIVAAIGFFLWSARRSGLAGRLALKPGLSYLALPWIASNTCQVLEAGIAAGMLFHDALELAAPACGNNLMASRLRAAADRLRAGTCDRLTTAMREVGMPTLVVQLIDGAEISGSLEDGLLRAANLQREYAESRSLWAGRIAAGCCFTVAVVVAAATVISMYAGYLNQITAMADEI